MSNSSSQILTPRVVKFDADDIATGRMAKKPVVFLCVRPQLQRGTATLGNAKYFLVLVRLQLAVLLQPENVK